MDDNVATIIGYLIFTAPLSLIILAWIAVTRENNKYIKEHTEGLTHNQRIIWMQAYEEAKSIGMRKEVDEYILATSKMDATDKALFLLKMKQNWQNSRRSTTASPNSNSPTSIWNIGNNR